MTISTFDELWALLEPRLDDIDAKLLELEAKIDIIDTNVDTLVARAAFNPNTLARRMKQRG